MKLLLDIEDNKATQLLSYLQELTFVKIEKLSPEKANYFSDLKEAAQEVNLAKEGKINLKSAKDLLDEL